MAYAADLKSVGGEFPCGFESRRPYMDINKYYVKVEFISKQDAADFVNDINDRCDEYVLAYNPQSAILLQEDT